MRELIRLQQGCADMSGKGFIVSIFIVGAAIAADEYFTSGYYTDGALAMLGQIRQAFGF